MFTCEGEKNMTAVGLNDFRSCELWPNFLSSLWSCKLLHWV